MSMIASARLHDLDPEDYLRDRSRSGYLELAPKHWLATRARLDAVEMEQEVGWLTIPPPR